MPKIKTFGKSYNPDILTCLANLSNDEVFTPPRIANDMLDLLPPELFRDPNTKFLDPACKTGVFLREITKRLIAGLADRFPDLEERVAHILHNQIYGIAITELTSLMSRRTLYCSKYPNWQFSQIKFDTPEGNIRFRSTKHTWKNGKCVFCGAPEATYDREDGLETHAYEFIHVDKPEEILNMNFDVIIGNPPYQLDDGGNSASAKPLYHFFVEQAQKLNPRYVTMIIPARWYNGGKGLDDFRRKMLKDENLIELVDYQNGKDCFPGLNISGGVCYFLWQKGKSSNRGCRVTNCSDGESNSAFRKLDEFPVFIRNNKAVNIVRKVCAKNEPSVTDRISTRNPFGLATNVRGHIKKKKGDLTLYTSKGVSYLKETDVKQGTDYIDCYKIMICRTTSGHPGEADSSGQFKILAGTRFLRPGEVCTDTYIIAYIENDREKTLNFYHYLLTKFSRFLISQTLTSINMAREVYTLVPMQDFSKSWTDEMLYEKYGLNCNEVSLIESLIKPMDGEGETNG